MMEATAGSDELRNKSQKLVQEIIILDGHIDLPYWLQTYKEDISKRTENGDFDYDRCKEGGLNAPFMSIYVAASYEKEGAKKMADTLIDMIYAITSEHPDKFNLANSPEEVRQHFREGKISLLMGMENGAPLEGDLKNVQYFFDKGIRYITLTHAEDNHICDSSYDTAKTHKGLSAFGYKVIDEMNRVGIMIDVSHVTDSTFFQVIRTSKAPVIASHSSCRYFTPGFERNMSDEMIKLLAEKGGVIQINFGSSFLDTTSQKSNNELKVKLEKWMKNNNLKYEDREARDHIEATYEKEFVFSNVTVVAEHIDHAVKLVGVDHVGLGSDFDGVGNTLPVGLKDVSQYPNLIYELLKKGYSDDDIRKICAENVLRVWDKAAAVAMQLQNEDD
ncbi:MAG: dipeptidase [Bacteroidia bacterium]|nr:dipeptidase [Bacteroidia bacterium]